MRKPIEPYDYDSFSCKLSDVRELEDYTAQLEKKLEEAQGHFNELNSLHPHDIKGNLEKWEEIFTFLKSLEQEKQNEDNM